MDLSMTNEQIFDYFKEVFEYIKEEANIPLEIIDDNEFKDGGINFYVSFVGPFGGIGANKKIKVDISRSEVLQFESVKKKVFRKLLRISQNNQSHGGECYIETKYK